ncbi:hypothetical protein LDENG_00024500 [Lucifuga dentata]|nr:hypothetical protein LDENG_00024500 [Lucifuga dentata]
MQQDRLTSCYICESTHRDNRDDIHQGINALQGQRVKRVTARWIISLPEQIHLSHLLEFLSLYLHSEAMDTTNAPKGCGSTINSVYYNLCDLTTVWGIVLEAIAVVGVLTSSVVFMSLVGSLPFVTDKKRKGMAVLQASILVFTLGLFGLAFAFIVGPYSITCVTRRFLFGVLFSGCFACLVMHGLWIALLERKGQGPRSWKLYLGALALWLVEVIINTEWLTVTTARSPLGGIIISDLSCSIGNEDFVMALIYVMVLLLAVVVVVAVHLIKHKHKQWRRDGAFILVTGLCTVAIWVAWIVMYLHGNQVLGNPSWDDPTLAVAVLSNAWVFICFYSIPEICLLTQEDPDSQQSGDEEHVFPALSLTQDNNVKQQEPPEQNLHIENKAFSVDEPNPAPKKALPPYSAVYQPTALSMIMQGEANKDQSSDTVTHKATAHDLQLKNALNKNGLR